MMENIDMMNEKDRDIARKIAEMYLEKHPREDHYGVSLASSDDDSEGTYYHTFTPEELAILRQYKENQKEDDITLNEYLELEGHEDLLHKCMQHNDLIHLDFVEDVDLEKPLHFTRFSIYVINQEREVVGPHIYGVSLTDEPYLTLMTELLYNSNHYSINLLERDNPQLAHYISSSMAYCFCPIAPFSSPYVCEMVELKDSVKSILDPFIDDLNLFSSEDENIKKFVTMHEIVPSCDIRGVYSIQEGNIYHFCTFYIRETQIEVCETINDEESGDMPSNLHFYFDARELMKKFGLEKPEDIYSYLHEHYNFIGGYAQLKKDLGV